MKRLLDVPKEKKARRELLRAHTLEVVKEIGFGTKKATLSEVRLQLAKRGWKAHDFKGRYGADDFERAVDRALQFHRLNGSIHYDGPNGWITNP